MRVSTILFAVCSAALAMVDAATPAFTGMPVGTIATGTGMAAAKAPSAFTAVTTGWESYVSAQCKDAAECTNAFANAKAKTCKVRPCFERPDHDR